MLSLGLSEPPHFLSRDDGDPGKLDDHRRMSTWIASQIAGLMDRSAAIPPATRTRLDETTFYRSHRHGEGLGAASQRTNAAVCATRMCRRGATCSSPGHARDVWSFPAHDDFRSISALPSNLIRTQRPFRSTLLGVDRRCAAEHHDESRPFFQLHAAELSAGKPGFPLLGSVACTGEITPNAGGAPARQWSPAGVARKAFAEGHYA
jgi:hypothetical protein